MAKQVKLVINNRNEQVNYDSNGKESRQQHISKL